MTETMPVESGELPRRARIPQKLFRPLDPTPTIGQVIERDPVLKALQVTGIVADADLEWLAATGRSYQSVELPPFVAQLPESSGECFAMAEWLEYRLGYTYVCGFALPPDVLTPLPHAWGAEGRSAIDPSWPDQTACRYFGIPGRSPRNMQRLHDIGTALHVAYGIEKPRRLLWAGVEI